MQLNFFPTTFWRLACCAILSLAVLAGPLASPVQAGGETMYTFDGMQFSSAERAKIGMADNQTKLGIAALNRNDWTAALQHCRTAWGTFIDLIPINDKTRVYFDQAGACMADAHANLGDVSKACGIYRSNGYQTYRMRDPRALCARQPAKAEVSPSSAAKPAISSTSNAEYAAAAGNFINRLAQLSAMPIGSARYAKAAELVPDCDKLRSFAASVAPALAAAGFCSGVVARERVDAKTSCKIMWTSAGQIRTAIASQLTPNMRAHAADLQGMLDSFGPTCARDGYPWPSFSAAWPH
jgi:hypothetical protein